MARDAVSAGWLNQTGCGLLRIRANHLTRLPESKCSTQHGCADPNRKENPAEPTDAWRLGLFPDRSTHPACGYLHQRRPFSSRVNQFGSDHFSIERTVLESEILTSPPRLTLPFCGVSRPPRLSCIRPLTHPQSEYDFSCGQTEGK